MDAESPLRRIETRRKLFEYTRLETRRPGAMSLFTTREWWSAKIDSSEEFDKGCMCVANIDNEAPKGREESGAASALGANAKIITGSFSGLLRIYYPRQGLVAGLGPQGQESGIVRAVGSFEARLAFPTCRDIAANVEKKFRAATVAGNDPTVGRYAWSAGQEHI